MVSLRVTRLTKSQLNNQKKPEEEDKKIIMMGTKRHSLQAVELSQQTQVAVQIVSNLPAPKPEMIVHDPVSFFSCQSIIPSEDYYLTDIEIDETIIIDAIKY